MVTDHPGQYLSPDPIGLLGGLNPYRYVHCPTGYIDPFGLQVVNASLLGNSHSTSSVQGALIKQYYSTTESANDVVNIV
ncbi:RHS repeat-associated core domain-containing protein [Proteus mirabilis]|uniref:RHS repeat-associated core domain-containing protein n=1 Tax=Proteus mirabilis TaxID=584 RepID=UPI00259E1236|nr:RHS repeat-associated core domain-containing protein [Proteus mirabilis]MDM5173918.1 RHS repeat-associated core domain-containing protein [Proteus mirabilis]MDM5185877.1 RHS repeat-associated core domain-containing protein [Proteus mirabilis]